jgi:hypothetical protein
MAAMVTHGSKRPAKCRQCGAELPPGGPRLVIDHGWLCPGCVFEREHGPVERVETKLPRQTKVPLQSETLFVPPTPIRRRRS